MTEQKTSSAISEKKNRTTEKPASTKQPRREQHKIGVLLGALAICIALAGGTGLFFYTKQQATALSEGQRSLNAQLTQLNDHSGSSTQQLTQQLSSQNAALQAATNQLAQMQSQLDQLRQKVSTISGNDTQLWKLSQADYLIKMAGRKLWSDQDTRTAAALLKNADQSLAEMNDPGLINVRRALSQDISQLSAINQIDFDGISLKINTLANSVDTLRLADDRHSSENDGRDSTNVSGSLREWRQNLLKSWHKFTNDFINIQRRNDVAQPLLSPNQNHYLRENIRLQLLIAMQAVPRHQQQIYQHALTNVSDWGRRWFDNNDPATKAFLTELDALRQQSVSITLPDSLSSQPLINKLIQQRMHGMTQPVSTAAQGE